MLKQLLKSYKISIFVIIILLASCSSRSKILGVYSCTGSIKEVDFRSSGKVFIKIMTNNQLIEGALQYEVDIDKIIVGDTSKDKIIMTILDQSNLSYPDFVDIEGGQCSK